MIALALGIRAWSASAQNDYREMICSYSWDCQKALRVANCESTMNSNAYAANNYGLFQVNGVHAARVGGDPTAFYDPETNVAIAYQLYLERGWQPWGFCGSR